MLQAISDCVDKEWVGCRPEHCRTLEIDRVVWVGDVLHALWKRPSCERGFPKAKAVQDDAERPYVRRPAVLEVAVCGCEHFWAHVVDGAHDALFVDVDRVAFDLL